MWLSGVGTHAYSMKIRQGATPKERFGTWCHMSTDVYSNYHWIYLAHIFDLSVCSTILTILLLCRSASYVEATQQHFDRTSFYVVILLFKAQLPGLAGTG